MIKYSKQREAIKSYLRGNLTHPTADEVYTSIRKEFPNISLGTVYRNLNQLAELGEIKKLTFTNGPDHFDYEMKPHYHFICRNCGRIYDITADLTAAVNEAAHGLAPGRIETHELVYYGTCRACGGADAPKETEA